MKQFSKATRERIRIATRQIIRLKIPVHSANASYFIVLSVFPTLLLLVGLLRYTPLDAIDLLELLEGVIPMALRPEAENLILSTYRSASKTVVGLSALTALWSASRGIYGLLTGMNAVYGVGENRGWLYTRITCVVYTFAFLIVLLLTLCLHVFGTAVVGMVERSSMPILRLLSGVIDLRFFLLVFLQTLLFCAMYTTLPNRQSRFWASMPGALLASVGWLVFSQLFSLYVEHFADYANLYGSVYAVALSMLWLYFCIQILFYGALLNRICEKA